MLFRTHFVFGIFLFLIFFKFIPLLWFFLIGLVVGVLVVDLDSSKSRLGKYWLFRPFQLFFEHRGIFHSLFFGFVILLLISILDVWIGIGFFVGFVSHLFLDAFTPSGVMLFWPVSTFRFRFFIRTSGFFEDIVFLIFLILDFVLFFYFFFPKSF